LKNFNMRLHKTPQNWPKLLKLHKIRLDLTKFTKLAKILLNSTRLATFAKFKKSQGYSPTRRRKKLMNYFKGEQINDALLVDYGRWV
jgi:hypothetical protein